MNARLPTPQYCIQHSRFTKQDGWQLYDLALSLNGSIALTGYNMNTHQTYVDVHINDSNSDCRDKPKLIYTKEFEKYEDEEYDYYGRLVSLFDCYDDYRGLVIATCLGDKIELIDLNEDQIIKSRKVTLENHGWINCLSVRERREIFVGFWRSNKIMVYDVIDLNEIRSVTLQGIQNGYFPFDMTATEGKLFVSLSNGKDQRIHKSLIFEEKSKNILSELTKPTDTHSYVFGGTVCTTLDVFAFAWSESFNKREERLDQIVFYSLLNENNCSFLIVEVECSVYRIRISEKGDRMITGDKFRGEVKAYDMADFFSYGHLKENLQSQFHNDECWRLMECFDLPKDQRDVIYKSETPTESLFLALEENGIIQLSNVDRLTKAFAKLKIKSSCSYLVDFYQKTRTPVFYKETIQKLQEEIKLKNKENEHLKKRLETENTIQVQNLQQELQRLKQEREETEQLLQQTKDFNHGAALERNKFKIERDQYKLQLSILEKNLESAKQDLLQTKELLQKATQEINAIRTELEQSQLQFPMSLMSLDGISGDDKLTETEQFQEEVRRSGGSVRSTKSGCLQESAIEHEFSRLLVKVSEQLRSDKCVVLATYFTLPEATIDLIRKDSSTAGITLLGVMKERNIINMYDVSKLQKALEDIGLLGIIHALLKPYQEKTHPFMYKQHKVMQEDD